MSYDHIESRERWLARTPKEGPTEMEAENQRLTAENKRLREALSKMQTQLLSIGRLSHYDGCENHHDSCSVGMAIAGLEDGSCLCESCFSKTEEEPSDNG